MIDKLFAVGISLKFDGDGKWWASVNYEDYGHAVNNSVCGNISTKYAQFIESAIDCIKKDAEFIGVNFINLPNHKPFLIIKNTDSWPYPDPETWLPTLQTQAERIGFELSIS